MAKTAATIMGMVFILAGLVGFISNDLFKAVPGHLELGTSDHVLHIVLGLIFIAGGLLTRVHLDRTAR